MYHLIITAAQPATHLAITPQQAHTAGIIGLVIVALIIISKLWNAISGKSDS